MVPSGVQKNVRLSEMGAETLRALKYDLDSSDGEVVALALERKAVERLQYHDAVVKRAQLGMIPKAEAVPSRAAIAALTAALNLEKPRFEVSGGGRVRPRPGFGEYSAEAQAVVKRAESLARELQLPRVSAAVLLLACCEAPEAERFAGLGVPAAALAVRLGDALRAQVDPALPANREEIELTPAAKSILVEGASGIAVLDGIQAVNAEHILVAALQSDDGLVAEARAALDIDADGVRALLWGGPADTDEAAPPEELAPLL